MAIEQGTAPHLAPIERLARGEAPAAGAPTAIPAATRGERATTLVVYALLLALALLYFVPFFWSVSTSFKTLPETSRASTSSRNHPTSTRTARSDGSSTSCRYV